MPEPARDEQADELLLRFARAAHRAGFPSDDLERGIEDLGLTLGRDVAVSATPTLVEIAIGTFPRQRTSTLRVTPQPVDLDLVGRLDDLAARLRSGSLDPTSALDELAAVRPLRRAWPVIVAAHGLAGAAVAPALGGGWRESLVAAAAGVLVGAVSVLGGRRANTQAILAPVTAIVAALACALVAEAGVDVAVEIATLGALVAMLPGMTLTIGMRELATNHLQSGLANTAVSFVQLVGLVFGVAVGTSIAAAWFGAAPVVAPDSFQLGIRLVAAVAAGVAFTITLNAQRRDAAWACSAAVLAIAADAAATPLVGDTAAVFVAALAVGLAGNALALLGRRSALVFIVPGILMLVPGSLGFESATRLLADDTVAGVAAAFDTLVAALSIVYGLLVSAYLLPERVKAETSPST